MGILDIFGGGGSVEMPDPKDYMPLVQQSADVNRLNQFTPFGQVEYVNNSPEALSWDDWSAQNGGGGQWITPETPSWVSNDEDYAGGGRYWQPGAVRSDYDAYVEDFNLNRGQPDVNMSFSPEIQSLFDKQFDPNAYQNYADDYFNQAQSLLDPIYERQTDRFEQSMFNRGQPVGGELYDDTYGNLMDSQNRGYRDAAFQGTQLAEQARLQDFNRLMSAMGGSQVAYPNIDTNAAANMAMNADIANLQSDNQASSNLWNTMAGLGGAYLTGGLSGGTPSIWSSPIG